SVGAGAALIAAERKLGDASIRWDLGRQEFVGRLDASPFPVVLVEASEDYPDGRPLMLIGSGKFGVDDWAEPLDGQMVNASGILVTHNGYEMLVIGQQQNLTAADSGSEIVPEPVVEDLGTITLKGEITDGKCEMGAMRPGNGKTHKGCANLCLIGKTPSLFLLQGEGDDIALLMTTGPDGEEMNDAWLDWTGLYVEASGKLTRKGGLVYFAIDPESLAFL
ncbi:MAG: hypothetical protein AAFY56_13040, partial [Pseudomonadota bacterium]